MQRGLCGGIGDRRTRDNFTTANRRYANNDPSRSNQHFSGDLHGVGGTPEIERKHSLPFRISFVARGYRTPATDVADQNIEATEGCSNSAHDALCLVGLRYIPGNDHRAGQIRLAARARSSALRALIAKRQPSTCNTPAITRPIPRDEPVTKADLPESSSCMDTYPTYYHVAIAT